MIEQLNGLDLVPATSPRRQVLRAVIAAMVGVMVLLGLASCGDEGEEGDD